MRTVVVGVWGTALLAWARSVGRAGGSTDLICGGDVAPSPHRLSRYLRATHVIPVNSFGTLEGARMVADYCARVGAAVVTAGSEETLLWLAQFRDEFSPNIRVLASPYDTLRKLGSKAFQAEFAAQVGFDVLPSWQIQSVLDISTLPSTAYPIVLRPDSDESVERPFKVVAFDKSNSAVAFLRSRGAFFGSVIAQSLVDGPNLLVHLVTSPSGEFVGGRCFRVDRKYDGVALRVGACAFPPGILERCRRFSSGVGITGPHHFDLLEDPDTGEVHFLEVNARLGGTTDKVLRLGFDEPLLALRSVGVPGSISRPTSIPKLDLVVVNKKAVLKRAWEAAWNRLTPLDYPTAAKIHEFSEAGKDLLRAANSIVAWDDPEGSAWSLLPPCIRTVPFVRRVADRLLNRWISRSAS